MAVYVNEFDEKAAHWLARLPMAFDRIDTRSIKDVKGSELAGFTQCHFFAGIGGWPLALKLAGWPLSEPVWTGSCPCQPFSVAGNKKGFNDDRHLWPEFRRLIGERYPSVVFGEQVASKAGRDWLALVRNDLEAMGYAVGAADLCAAGVGAPHVRQRLFWVAHRDSRGLEINAKQYRDSCEPEKQAPPGVDSYGCCDVGGMGDAQSDGRKQGFPNGSRDNEGTRTKRLSRRPAGYGGDFWGEVEYTPCRDGKARPTKPGVRVLANGVPGRVAQLRGLGNAIVPQVAAEFIAASMASIRLANCDLL